MNDLMRKINPAEMSVYLDEVSSYLRGLLGDEQDKYCINIFISDEVAKLEVSDSMEEGVGLVASASFEEYNGETPSAMESAESIYKALMAGTERDIKRKALEALSGDYESVRDKIIARLVPENKMGLENSVAIKAAEGLNLAACFLIECSNKGVLSIMVPKEVAARYGLLEEKIILDAVMNTQRLFPATLFSLDEFLNSIELESAFIYPDLDEDFDSAVGKIGRNSSIQQQLCLSTSNRTNGAVACVYSGVLKKIADAMSDDLFLVFTSVHEVMIHAVGELLREGLNSETLKLILKETLDEAVTFKDKLTDNIYIYRRDKGVIEKA